MAQVERHPGTFGLRRPDRSVSLERPLQNASTDTRLRGSGRPSSDSSIPDWALNIVNSTLGSILGRGSLPETQRAAAEWAAPALSLPTPGGAMRQEGTVNAIDTALNLVRPLALADVGVAGAAGSMMFPFPGLAPGAAPAVGAARKAGGGIAGALSGLLGRGGDEAADVAGGVMKMGDEVGPVVARADVPYPYGRTPAWVDEAGTEGPVILHGTSRLDPIEGFEIGSAQRGWGSEGGARANAGLQGVYGTTSPELAQIYTGSASVAGGAGGRVYNLTLDGTPRVLDLTAGKPMPSDIRELLRARMMEGPNMHLRTPEMRAMLADETTSVQDLLQNSQALLDPVVGTTEAHALREAITELYDVAKTAPHTAAGEHSILRRYTNEENVEWIFLKPEDVRVARSTIDPPRSPDWMFQPEHRRALEAREAARARATGAPYEPGRYDPSLKPDPGPYKGVV